MFYSALEEFVVLVFHLSWGLSFGWKTSSSAGWSHSSVSLRLSLGALDTIAGRAKDRKHLSSQVSRAQRRSIAACSQTL